MGDPDNDFDQDDFRSEEAKKYDALNEQILTLLGRFDRFLEQKSTNQEVHVTHRTEGGGWVSMICACVAVCALFGSMGIGYLVIVELGKQTAELHDLHAWRDVHSNEIGALKAWRQQTEKK